MLANHSSTNIASFLTNRFVSEVGRRQLSQFRGIDNTAPQQQRSWKSSSPTSAAFLAPNDEVVGKSKKRPAYFDYQATTPMDPRVVDKMLPTLLDVFGNAHSRTHAFGWEAEELVESARSHVANLIGAEPREIIFTSGATESNNMAIKGLAEFYGKSRGKKHIVTVQTEHKCVLASCQALEAQGWEVTYLPVDAKGLVDLQLLEQSLRDETAFVSVMMVNNEIGVIQPIKQIAEVCKKRKVFLHCDAAQAAGKIPIDVNALGVDAMSISGHKMYGPKGIGALYVRAKPRVRLSPLISGGGQERGLRSGTLPVPLVVGFGEAARLAAADMESDLEHVQNLSKKLQDKLKEQLPEVTLNGSAELRYPGNVNLSFACVEGESLLMALDGVAVSSGSACTSASLEPSYVLRALGTNEEDAHTSLRFGIGRFTTEEEIDKCVATVVEKVNELRELSPLWEIHLSGGDSASEMVWT